MSSTPNAPKQYAPSQSVTDESGRRWRLCAAAAVLNSSSDLLVGERLGIPGAWQAPQGGVDVGETIVEAAVRELYEETGLVLGKHVVLEKQLEGGGVRYKTGGTNSWISRAGYAGQELHWVVFRCVDGRGDDDPATMSNLEGLNGEKAEFSKLKWEHVDKVVEGIWEKKVEPYRVLLHRMDGIKRVWEARCAQVDFDGMWVRDPEMCVGVIESLVERGMKVTNAEKTTREPYVQLWRRASDRCQEGDSNKSPEWFVTTYAKDGVTPRRELRYRLGKWEEAWKGESTLFGSGEGGVVKRRTFFVPESGAEPEEGLAHVTVSETPLGIEEARRYLKDDRLVLRRLFWSLKKPHNAAASTEVFLRKKNHL